MTATGASPGWPRPYWQPGGEPALLQFFVFGRFADELRIPAARYQSAGLPDGVQLQRFGHAAIRGWEGYPLAGALGELLREDAPQAVALAEASPDVLVVRGECADGPSLDYLRDTLGVLAGLLDIGGIAVLDPQILTLFDAEAWRAHYLIPGGAPPRHHVLILCNAEAEGPGAHVHTRGMRKFGRPDLSFRGVPDDQSGAAGRLCEHLVELMALGAGFQDGQVLEVDGLAELTVHREGAPDDPRFNNRHLRIDWPR